MQYFKSMLDSQKVLRSWYTGIRIVMHSISKITRCFLCICVVIAAVAVSGCKSPQEYKQQADNDVYKIINDKWKPEYGSKSNYRISDVAPDANDIKPLQVNSEKQIISLAQAVCLATSQNRNYQRQKELLYLAALDLTTQRHEFADQWFGTFDSSYNKDTGEENIDYAGRLGFNRLLKDGTQISSSIAVEWMRYLTGDPRTSLGSVLSGTISKPLLRGSSEKIVTENLTQAERNALYQIRSFNRYRKTFVVTVVADYFRVLQNLDSVKNAQNNYSNLQFAYDRANMLAESGRLPQLEADQTKQNMLKAKDTLTQTVRRYEQSLDDFRNVLALPVEYSVELNYGELDGLVAMGVDGAVYGFDEAVETGLRRRLDLMNSADQVIDAGRKIDVTEDALRAGLELVASANVDSPDGQRPGRLEFNDGQYSVGLGLDLPLDRLNERNTYRKSLIDFIAAQRDYEQAIEDVKLEIRSSYRKLLESAERYRIQQQSLALAQERVKSTNMLVEAGRAQSRDLLDAQDDLLSAQNATTSALIDYTIEKLNFFSNIGVLEVRPDGMWHI